ncbi:hypothetical protein ACFLTE_03960 [Bacteroidota bacterium]
MDKYLYLSATPEALIASMLPPAEFGSYLAVGTKKRTRGQAIFFEIDLDAVTNNADLDYINKRCVSENNLPKRSVYISIYRVLENILLNSLKSLYLTTDDGKVLELKKSPFITDEEDFGLHLYQELLPVTPRVASSLNPNEFMQYMTGQVQHIRLPKLFFVELNLNNLAEDPENGSTEDLPYSNIEHLRDCLAGLKNEPQKIKKTVIRFYQGDILYRTCKNGFFIGDEKQLLYYPFPSQEELKEKYYSWWKSASLIGIK